VAGVGMLSGVLIFDDDRPEATDLADMAASAGSAEA
jgi:hypothetical protein